MNKLVLHAFASEVVEYIYSQCQSDRERREMVFSLYGNYSLVLEEVFPEGHAYGDQNPLKVFMEKKPQIAANILTKMEPMGQKLVEKGNSRHSFVQAVLLDYVECQAVAEDGISKLKFLADLLKEKMPAILASKEGLRVACALFNLLEAKDRKAVVKSLPADEMSTNRIAHLFIVHVANNLDDTQLTKKKVLHDVLVKIDDHIEDFSFQTVLNASLMPLETEEKDGRIQYKNNSLITPDELQSMSLFLDKSTSKKDRKIRSGELFKIVQKPLEMFYEERLSYQLLDTKPNKVMKNLFVGLAEQGEASQSDLVDEMLRQVQKPYEGENAAGVKQLLFGHPLVHRMLKDMIKGEVAKTGDVDNAKKQLKFSYTVSKILLKHFTEAINGRGVFILLELLENPKTQEFVLKHLSAQKKEMKDLLKKDSKAKGL